MDDYHDETKLEPKTDRVSGSSNCSLVEGELTFSQIDEFSKISAALLVGMAAGLTNLENARGWDDEDKREFADAVNAAKRMLWDGEPTGQIERCMVVGLVDDMMLGLVTGADAYEAIRDALPTD